MGGNTEGIVSPINEIIHPCVIAMGNPLLDLIAEVPMDFIEKYKLKMNDSILAEPNFHDHLYDELETNFQVDYLPGGAGQNSIRLCQAFIDIPNATGYIGCIAEDKYGKKLQEVMKEEGIYNLYAYSEKTKETGICGVLLNNKERSLCTRLCAANDYEIKFLKENKNTWDCIQNANIFYSAGYFLCVCPEAMKTVGEYCSNNDKIFCTNLSAEYLIEYFKEPMMEVLEYADFVFSNDAEYLHFAKVHNLGTDSLPVIAEKVLNFPKKNKKRNRTVIITNGDKEVIVATKRLDEEVKITTYPVIYVSDDKIVDTNGAGDAFVGGFLYGLYKNQDVHFCILCAIFAASHIIQNSGCSFDKTFIKKYLTNFV